MNIKLNLKSQIILLAILCTVITSAGAIGNKNTDIEKIRHVISVLFSAYENSDMNTIISIHDFVSSADIIKKKFELTGDVSQLADSLKNEYVNIINKNGFPDYSNAVCNVGRIELLRKDIALVIQECINIGDKDKQTIKLYLKKYLEEWKVLSGIAWSLKE